MHFYYSLTGSHLLFQSLAWPDAPVFTRIPAQPETILPISKYVSSNRDMTHPYKSLPKTAFWKPAVAACNPLEIRDLWDPKFAVRPQTRIATFGSCFAQHFSKALIKNGYSWINAEHPPKEFSEADQHIFNYNVFSARTGNIYTASLLLQWLLWATGKTAPSEEVWQKSGRFYDPFRPAIEPNGFETGAEMMRSRNVTLNALNAIVKKADIFVFTLGLTESWFNTESGVEYPMCPGTTAGDFDKNIHQYVAQDSEFVVAKLRQAISLLREINKNIRVLLTVSPVPLVATNSGQHVLVATSASKSILRAATVTAVNDFDFVDYFPSYEIINSPVFRGGFFMPNLRSVTPEGVAFVMAEFFRGATACATPAPARKMPPSPPLSDSVDELHCDEEILEMYAELGGSSE